MTSANNPYVNPKSDERLVMQVKASARGRQVGAHPPRAGPAFGHGGPRAVVGARDARRMPTGAGGAHGPPGKDKGWAEMSDGEKKAAGASATTRRRGRRARARGVHEAVETLEGTVKAAAVSLGYTQEEWDAELEPAADDAAAAGRAGRGGATEGRAATPRSARLPLATSPMRRRPRPPPRPTPARCSARTRRRHDGGRARRRGGHRLQRALGRGETLPAAALRFAALSADQRSAVLVLGHTQARGC